MNIISLLAGVKAPTDLWNNLISWLNGSIGSIGWTILILTVLVKLATSPLDFMVKLSTKKQTLVQQKCAPQVAKLQKKFGNDRQTLQVQTNALYKREGLNLGVGCIVMLVNLVLTCTIFFTFFSSLRTISAYQAIKQYETVHSSYVQTYQNYVYETKSATDSNYTIEDAKLLIENLEFVNEYELCQAIVADEDIKDDSDKHKNAQEFITENSEKYSVTKPLITQNTQLFEDATLAGQKAVVKTWNENKDSWLWVENIWVADAPTYVFPTYDSLKSTASNANDYYKNYVSKNIDKSEYNAIASAINSNSDRDNGFYILAILAGLITFLSQFISELHNKLKNKKANNLASANQQNAGSMKILKIVMPIVMVMFVISSTASFGIYLLASNIASIVLGEAINFIVNICTKKQRLEVEEILEKEADRLIRKGKLQG